MTPGSNGNVYTFTYPITFSTLACIVIPAFFGSRNVDAAITVANKSLSNAVISVDAVLANATGQTKALIYALGF